MNPHLRHCLLACLVAGTTPAALAAGGHHAVDDAEILDPGACEVQTWIERARPARLLHLGAACRVGPVQLGIAGDYTREDGSSLTDQAVELKWAREVAEGWSAGVAVSRGWQARARPRYQGTTAAGLLSWAPREDLSLHANLGRDFVHEGDDERRGGISIDWTPGGGAWTLIGERFRQEGGHFARAALRWTPAKDWTLDLSRAVRLHGAGTSSWVLALKRDFER
jgi:hypothetical protein